jgi:hypothetical protein
VVPPAVQQLLDQLPKLPINSPTLNLPAAGGPAQQSTPTDPQSADKLLNFLLAP